VLYALPELDGAIDPVPLGGLVGEDIYLIPERVQRLIGRLKRWIAPTSSSSPTPNCIVLYGFPLVYGATNSCLAECAAITSNSQALKTKATVGDLPEDGEELIRWVKQGDEDHLYHRQRPDAEKNGSATYRRPASRTMEIPHRHRH